MGGDGFGIWDWFFDVLCVFVVFDFCVGDGKVWYVVGSLGCDDFVDIGFGLFCWFVLI